MWIRENYFDPKIWYFRSFVYGKSGYKCSFPDNCHFNFKSCYIFDKEQLKKDSTTKKNIYYICG